MLGALGHPSLARKAPDIGAAPVRPAPDAAGGGHRPTIRAGRRSSLALQRVPGRSLDDLLTDQGPRPWGEAAALLAPVAEALAAVHRAGWVHGDVSPANVVVDATGLAVLVDLGCSRPAHRARATGTPGSTAPEVEAGAPASPAADVWALAAVAVELTTGSAPGPDLDLTPAATLALARALSPDPVTRPSAGELAATLRASAQEAPGAPRTTPLAAAPNPTRAPRVTREYGPRPVPARPPRRRRRFARLRRR